MDDRSPANSPFTIHPDTRVGAVTLAVADLDDMRRFYETVMGLDVMAGSSDEAVLGAGGRPLLRLMHRPAGQAEPHATGLYHFALLVTSRAHLGAWLAHMAGMGHRLDGAGDHDVSEALYLSDPEGNGIEVYRDRPRTEWTYEGGRVRMGTEPVDIRGVLDAGAGVSWRGMPAGTTMGHIHLRVADVAATEAFYTTRLGMTTMAMLHGAGFFSAGGYHHHIGANTWHSRGAGPPAEGALGLVEASIVLPDSAALEGLVSHLDDLRQPIDMSGPEPLIRDPSGLALRLTVA
ncbi:MAG: VOC family protein [Rhodothermales bacterium]|nr:VOC family protein [Rhodothermales bacterium]